MRRIATLALSAATLGLLAPACNALLDIDDIEFGDGPTSTPAGGSGGGVGGGTGGAGGAVGGAGGAVGGSGGMVVVEQCTNGIDDDGDDDVDCSDADCAAFRCVAPAPLGWSGPVVSYLGDPAAGPSCASPWTAVEDLHNGLSADAVTCGACSCASPVGGTCGAATLTVYDSGSSCGGTVAATLGPLNDGQCQPFSLSDGENAALAPAVPAGNEGSCAPSGGAVVTSPVPTFTELGRLCGGSVGAGCSGGDVCAVAPVAPFELTSCIYHFGDVPCPAPYDDRFTAYGSYDDGRGCGDCTCGAASGGSCLGEVRIHETATCTAQRDVVPTDGATCVPFTKQSGSVVLGLTTTVPSGGECPPIGGEPQGSVAPTELTTVCCAVVGGSGGGGAGGAGGSGGSGGSGTGGTGGMAGTGGTGGTGGAGGQGG